MLVIGVGAGTFDIGEHRSKRGRLARGHRRSRCLLLFAGVAGKSAQFPLHTWLPDAMVGPTPISALIHAATMVAAGVYVVARLCRSSSRPAAARRARRYSRDHHAARRLAALAQDDIKRVLAWSTVSQIAYMVVGSRSASGRLRVFHLLTHAAFKGLLFLAAGCVLHATGQALMSRMGGLRQQVPLTFVTMTCGLAALIGLPPFAGFFSKEAVLGAAYESARGHGEGATWVGWLVLLAGLITVALTAAYATRLWLRTFFGAPRTPDPVRPLPPLMSWPLVVLAVPTVLLGIIGLRSQWLPTWVGVPTAPLTPEAITTVLSLLLSAGAIAAVVVVWRKAPERDPIPPRPVLANAFYLDQVQDHLVVRPYRRLADEIRDYDKQAIDGTVEGTGKGAVVLSSASRAQTGNVQLYATLVLGTATVFAIAAVWL